MATLGCGRKRMMSRKAITKIENAAIPAFKKCRSTMATSVHETTKPDTLMRSSGGPSRRYHLTYSAASARQTSVAVPITVSGVAPRNGTRPNCKYTPSKHDSGATLRRTRGLITVDSVFTGGSFPRMC